MWLLSTDRAELYYFSRNFDAAGGYAVLSHTWDGDEQTLQEVRAIGERCRASGTNPRDDPALSPKIRNCCIAAEKHGYRWVWIDSCCIDKTSSSELSEAINSMFRWYKEAEVCFAYLADVSRNCLLHADESAFRRSRWHTRGWTLQELIAPDFLIFLSSDWHELGNRAGLAGLLNEITRIPFGVLTGTDKPAEYSVCIRMSWASRRKTTRVEDEAYCLMGLFGVSIPTNYGEGKHAFIRLQYEIMQHNSDMSLFAFGAPVWQGESLVFHPGEKINHSWKYLMADSPREFDYGFLYVPDLGRHATQQYPPPLVSSKNVLIASVNVD
uniref:Transcriptional regulator SlyA n=1 Tax=Ganoderma boninense TaxID=34458 RepID=A0A5K1JUG5_9APHY|nr:Transcriptional regulator SlyA [Ganoderma boninense]